MTRAEFVAQLLVAHWASSSNNRTEDVIPYAVKAADALESAGLAPWTKTTFEGIGSFVPVAFVPGYEATRLRDAIRTFLRTFDDPCATAAEHDASREALRRAAL